MEDRALLDAIGQMMDSKLAAEREHTRAMLLESETRVVNQFKAVLETDVTRKINLLVEGHGDVVKKLEQLDTLTDKMEDIQTTVEVLRHMVVKE